MKASRRRQLTASIALAVGLASGAVAQNKEPPVGKAEGVIRGVDPDEHKLMIAHGPISGGIDMPAMTMAFQVAPGVDLSSLEKGQTVKFTVTRDDKGRYLVTGISRQK
ncbi:copper-binding protein [Methylocystis sp. IM3]|uniref:copper-binding protein n=1 Tax=unclassified Methylocystis TaxID=2625913 RepID=UPI0030FAB0DC